MPGHFLKELNRLWSWVPDLKEVFWKTHLHFFPQESGAHTPTAMPCIVQGVLRTSWCAQTTRLLQEHRALLRVTTHILQVLLQVGLVLKLLL